MTGDGIGGGRGAGLRMGMGRGRPPPVQLREPPGQVIEPPRFVFTPNPFDFGDAQGRRGSGRGNFGDTGDTHSTAGRLFARTPHFAAEGTQVPTSRREHTSEEDSTHPHLHHRFEHFLHHQRRRRHATLTDPFLINTSASLPIPIPMPSPLQVQTPTPQPPTQATQIQFPMQAQVLRQPPTAPARQTTASTTTEVPPDDMLFPAYTPSSPQYSPHSPVYNPIDPFHLSEQASNDDLAPFLRAIPTMSRLASERVIPQFPQVQMRASSPPSLSPPPPPPPAFVFRSQQQQQELIDFEMLFNPPSLSPGTTPTPPTPPTPTPTLSSMTARNRRRHGLAANLSRWHTPTNNNGNAASSAGGGGGEDHAGGLVFGGTPDFEARMLSDSKKRFSMRCTACFRALIAQGMSKTRALHAVQYMLCNARSDAPKTQQQSRPTVSQEELTYVMNKTGFSRAVCLDVLALRHEIAKLRKDSKYHDVVSQLSSRLSVCAVLAMPPEPTQHNQSSPNKNQQPPQQQENAQQSESPMKEQRSKHTTQPASQRSPQPPRMAAQDRSQSDNEPKAKRQKQGSLATQSPFTHHILPQPPLQAHPHSTTHQLAHAFRSFDEWDPISSDSDDGDSLHQSHRPHNSAANFGSAKRPAVDSLPPPLPPRKRQNRGP